MTDMNVLNVYQKIIFEVLKFMCNAKHNLNHSHKKRKDSLETRAVLSIFFLELEISGVAVQGIDQNSEKWRRLLGTVQ